MVACADCKSGIVTQSYLEQFGQLLDMRVFRKNCYGFAQYAQHGDAVMAILGVQHLLLSWPWWLMFICTSQRDAACCADTPIPVPAVCKHASSCASCRPLMAHCSIHAGLNGLQLGGKVLRLSWGRHQARAAAAATAAMTPSPMMAAAAAAGPHPRTPAAPLSVVTSLRGPPLLAICKYAASAHVHTLLLSLCGATTRSNPVA